MRFPRAGSQALQQRLARAGTVVWLLAGIALLAATVRTQWPASPASAARTSAPAGAPASLGQREAARSLYRPAAALESGEEIVLVFIGASFCNAHNRAGFPAVVEDAKVRVQEYARARNLHFRAVGVALDWRVADGLAFLARFGEFDEVASGSNWISDGATKYVWREIPGDADVPQVLVLRRSVDVSQAVRLGEDRLVKRIHGAVNIEQWVSAGASL
jgi:hypothetical protein